MLAYRHAFHAGNHADVLKHCVLTAVLRYMNSKPKAYRLIDTHAGAGGYSLQGQYARKKGEFEQGIARLMAHERPQAADVRQRSPEKIEKSGGAAFSEVALPPAIADYVDLVRQFNPNGRLEQYPGSPAIARMLLRPGDQHRLFEIHPTDHRILQSYLKDMKGVEVMDVDGFDGLKGQVPPSTRRAVILMDPSYEGRADYGKVVLSLRDALTRFAEGVYVIWYPQVNKLEAAQLPKRLIALAPKGWLHVRMTVQPSSEPGFGLAGSGVFVINPPYTLHEQLQASLPFLVKTLGQYAGAHYEIERHDA
jgi:23S rRNA (adenine2030-N6)-methyltransferase